MSKVKPKVLGTKPQRRGKPKDPLAGFLDPADAIVPCRVCGAEEGQPCSMVHGGESTIVEDRATSPRARKAAMAHFQAGAQRGTVHFARRFKRLLLTANHPEKREEFEKKAVAMLREYLKATR